MPLHKTRPHHRMILLNIKRWFLPRLRWRRITPEANYPGGESAWRDFLMKNLKANTPADKGAPIGKYTVIVKFVVGKDGNITGVAAETNHGYGMEEEVIRMINKSGAWTPARQNGRTVNAYRRQPISFLVEEDNFEVSSKVPYTLLIGSDNIVDVNIKRVKNRDITLTISQGSITATDDDRFIARVTEPGRAVITVYNKNNRKLGAASFQVK